MTMTTRMHEQVRDYYGKVLSDSRDLKTGACCSADSMPAHLRAVLRQIEPEIVAKFYGCGSPIPPAIEGCTVLDLGCGTGRDTYICSKLVGESGRVIGVDMTEAQLAVAQRHGQTHAQRFGYDRPNTTFLHGYMEDLAALGIEDESVDVVISNCVINLAPDKERVFAEIFRVLRPGGELYFSDMFADRRLPAAWLDDPVLVGECLAGAMYQQDFRRVLVRLGVPDYRVVSTRAIAINDADIAARVGAARFCSMTVRAFKLASLEDERENYGQVARYLGTIAHAPHAFVLDDHHEFVAGKPMLVCGNTAAMVSETRLAPHFEVDGDRSVHYGLFPYGPEVAADSKGDEGNCRCC
ncbi:MAG TPA: methyltransferase domain-containing protein [Phycisphaerae bacterium]|nr:methyltransferase domain-containing protein [Phycisphaerae bacterium]